MPSSISHFKTAGAGLLFDTRPVPEKSWARSLLLVLALECALTAGWETFWRHHDFVRGPLRNRRRREVHRPEAHLLTDSRPLKIGETQS